MSTIKANQWLNPDGTENYKCRAWVNFNMSGTPSIRGSGNVSSITDSSQGVVFVNFTTSMPDTNYATTCCGTFIESTGSQIFQIHSTTVDSVSRFRYDVRVVDNDNNTFALTDAEYCHAAIFR